MSIPEHISTILPRVLLAVGAPYHPQEAGVGMTELKPCPFCGGKATANLTMRETTVGCPNDGCGAFIVRRNHRGGLRNEAAIAAWNRREGEV